VAEYKDNVTVTAKRLTGTPSWLSSIPERREQGRRLNASGTRAERQRASVKIVQGETNEQAAGRQKEADKAIREPVRQHQ